MQGCIPPSARVIPPVPSARRLRTEHECDLNQGSVLSRVAAGEAVQQRAGGAEVFTLGGARVRYKAADRLSRMRSGPFTICRILSPTTRRRTQVPEPNGCGTHRRSRVDIRWLLHQGLVPVKNARRQVEQRRCPHVQSVQEALGGFRVQGARAQEQGRRLHARFGSLLHRQVLSRLSGQSPISGARVSSSTASPSPSNASRCSSFEHGHPARNIARELRFLDPSIEGAGRGRARRRTQ